MAEEKEMTFLEHLEEMRGVILRCVAVFSLSFICVLIGFHYFNNLMMYPLNSAKRIIAMWVQPSSDEIKADDQKLGPVFLVGTQKDSEGKDIKQGPFFIVPTENGIVLKPQNDENANWYNAIKLRSMSFTTPLILWFYVGFIGAVGFSLPVMLYFIARFIAPGLKPEELKMLRPGMIAGVVLFLVGACFAFTFILPMGIAFMSYMSQTMNLEMFPDAQSYYSMVIFVTLAIGLTFQLPLLVTILVYLGVLDPEWLRKNRKIVFFGILLFATVVTPPDALTQVSITIPLYLMYEVAVVVGTRLRKKKLKRERLEELRQEEEDARERKEYAQMVAKERLEEQREEAESQPDEPDEETLKEVKNMDIDKSTYGDRASDEYENSYDNYPFDPYNPDSPDYDPDYNPENDPYASDPYIHHDRYRDIPNFSPDWDLNREDTSFMAPDWSLNVYEKAAAENAQAGEDISKDPEENSNSETVAEDSLSKESEDNSNVDSVENSENETDAETEEQKDNPDKKSPEK